MRFSTFLILFLPTALLAQRPEYVLTEWHRGREVKMYHTHDDLWLTTRPAICASADLYRLGEDGEPILFFDDSGSGLDVVKVEEIHSYRYDELNQKYVMPVYRGDWDDLWPETGEYLLILDESGEVLKDIRFTEGEFNLSHRLQESSLTDSSFVIYSQNYNGPAELRVYDYEAGELSRVDIEDQTGSFELFVATAGEIILLSHDKLLRYSSELSKLGEENVASAETVSFHQDKVIRYSSGKIYWQDIYTTDQDSFVTDKLYTHPLISTNGDDILIADSYEEEEEKDVTIYDLASGAMLSNNIEPKTSATLKELHFDHDKIYLHGDVSLFPQVHEYTRIWNRGEAINEGFENLEVIDVEILSFPTFEVVFDGSRDILEKDDTPLVIRATISNSGTDTIHSFSFTTGHLDEHPRCYEYTHHYVEGDFVPGSNIEIETSIWMYTYYQLTDSFHFAAAVLGPNHRFDFLSDDNQKEFELPVTTSVETVRTDAFSVSPNPVSDVLQIEGAYDQEKMNWQIISMDSKTQSSGIGSRIDLSSLQAGIYVLSLRYQDRFQSIKVIKQ